MKLSTNHSTNMQCNLFIDTAQDKCNLAIFNKKIVKKVSIPTHNNLTDLVVEKVSTLIKGYDIKDIYITNGPGSFTGERVSCLIAKTWKLIHNSKIYILDSLSFQLPNLEGISLINAKTNRTYICIYKNHKMILKPQIMLNEKTSEFIEKYKSLNIYRDYKNVDVFENLLTNLKYFKLVGDLKNITPCYLKQPIYGKTIK